MQIKKYKHGNYKETDTKQNNRFLSIATLTLQTWEEKKRLNPCNTDTVRNNFFYHSAELTMSHSLHT